MSNLVARIGVQPFVLVENLVILCKHFIDQIRIDSPTVNVEEKSARKSNDFLVLETGIGCGFLSTKTLLLFTTYLFANRCRRVSTKHADDSSSRPKHQCLGSLFMRGLPLLVLVVTFATLPVAQSLYLYVSEEPPNIPDYEITALHDLYSATDGPSWHWFEYSGNEWDFTDPDPNPCADHWMGVVCSENVTAAGYLHVVELELFGFELRGALPASLGNLTQVEILEFRFNYLTGSIPSTLGNCSRLTVLDLSDNVLTGSIPDSLGQCKNLTILNIYDNKLSGRIPETLGQCTQLMELGLGRNQLTGSIPDTLGRCTQLVLLELYQNQLTGSIPDTLGQCTELFMLNLFRNNLQGHIPDVFQNCTQLFGLELYQNQLSGPIPSFLSRLQNLRAIALHENELTGSIPNTLCETVVLREVKLYSNQLTGSIPDTFGQCVSLTELLLYDNKLTGHIPASLGECANIQKIILHINQLSGSIPDSLSRCTMLFALILYDNALTSIIPAALGELDFLLLLDLQDNHLTGSIPNSLSQCFYLVMLFLDGNGFTGRIPEGMGQSEHLQIVDFGGNQLSGTLPGLFFNSSSNLWSIECDNNFLTGRLPEISTGEKLGLQQLNIGSNDFTGTIPTSFVAALCLMNRLYLNDNRFTGTLPQNWSALEFNATVLSLQGNRLRGPIPDSLGHLPLLQSLNLSSNRLTGTIPASFQQLGALQSLLLKGNRLRGSIEQLFSPDQRNLTIVQLSGNQLTGTLPAEVFLLPNLESFAAVENCFESPLPVEAICNSASLNALVLDGLHAASPCRHHVSLTNKLFTLGTLPRCLLTMSTLTTLHLSGSGLTGSLPSDVEISAVLTDLSLSHNLLTGKIPGSILGRDWANLDLSFNRLTGTLLSTRAVSFNNGSQLNLKHNRLSGEIPGSMKQVGSLSVLESNLFSCRVDRSDVPEQDTDSDQYSCGSDAVNNALYVWLGLAAAIGAGVVFVAHRKLIPTTLHEWLWAEKDGRVLAFKKVMQASHALSVVGAASAAYCVMVLLPVYAVIDTYHPTFTYQYAWTASGAYFTGTTAFAVEAVFLLLQPPLCGWLAVRLELMQDPLLLRKASTFVEMVEQPRGIQSGLLNTALMLFSLTVVVGINVGFVLATLRFNGRVLTVIQILLALFKLGFNSYAAPALQQQVNKILSVRESASVVHRITTTKLLLALLNVIVIPCLVVMVISPDCFYDLLTGSDTVTSSFAYLGICEAPTVHTQDGGFYIVTCMTRTFNQDKTSYTPPFEYSYQCSSSFITYYAPTFVIMCIISGFLVPAQRLLLLWLRRKLPPGSVLYSLVDSSTPRKLKELPCPEVLANFRSDPLKRPVFIANQLVISLLTYLALLLTFGALFPPLAVCCAVAMASLVLTARLEVGRYVTAAVAAGRQDCLDELESVCADVAPPLLLQRAMAIVLSLSCMFYTLFLFDTLGNEVGFVDAYWVLIVVPLLPIVGLTLSVAACVLLGGHLTSILNPEANAAPSKSAADPEMGVELGSVLTMPQQDGLKNERAAGDTVASSSNPLHVV